MEMKINKIIKFYCLLQDYINYYLKYNHTTIEKANIKRSLHIPHSTITALDARHLAKHVYLSGQDR